MDFDFQHITAPFRMQPGLSRLGEAAPRLTPLDPSGRLHQEKRRVLEAGQSRHCVAGFDPAPALECIARRADFESHGAGLRAGLPLELAFEEDFAILDGRTGTLPWFCICTPSHWAPEDKLGMSLAMVHAAVADNAMLVAASRQLVRLVTDGRHWQRHVWTISPSARYDQHPRRHPRAPWPATDDPRLLAEACFLRVERQTFLPVGRGTSQAVFTIRVGLQPLAQAVDAPWKARRLHDALASMSDAVAVYKGLDGARSRLLQWLAGRGAGH